jgi:hypothetical protein
MIRDKSIHINDVDLDIISDGLFVLSCLGELNIHRKVIRKFLFFEFIVFFLFLGNFWFRRY